MPLPLIRSFSTFPFPPWAQQLSGILPLSALIDVATKLHVFELNGSVPLWNWPMTPAGARLLLSSEDRSSACCLDRPTRSFDLHCIDGRYGNFYPSQTPTTTRLLMSAQKPDIVIKNTSSNMADETQRKQSLDIFIVYSQDPAGPSVHFRKTLSNVLPGRRFKYWLLSGVGWLCLITITIISLMSGLYIASVYLLLMPLTGFIVRLTHGGGPRRLLNHPISPWPRLVVVTRSVNSSEWSAFYGGSSSLNALLNKPLFRPCVTPAPDKFRHLTRLIIAGQWILAVGSCARQDWNAVFISLWMILCSCFSAYGYQPEESVRDWLQYTCSIHIKRVHAKFSTRRALLSALLYLNPDSKDRCTDWMDPILSNKRERSEWESTALTFINTGSCDDETMKRKYWWKFLVEGVEVGINIKKLVITQSKGQA